MRPQRPIRDRKVRSAILAGVLHENLRLADPRTPARGLALRRRPRWGLYAAVLVVAAIIGGAIYPELIATATVSQSPEHTTPQTGGGRLHAEASAGPTRPGGTAASRSTPAGRDSAPHIADRAKPAAPGTFSEVDPADYRSLLEASGTDIADLFGLDVRTIVIDPGHGGRDPGAISPNGIQEKDIALDIAKHLRERLLHYPRYRIFMTRERDQTVSLKRRVTFAQSQNADLFISVHINHLPVESLTLIETYYFGPHTDAQALELARYENKSSGYTTSAFKAILERLGDTLKLQESRELAQSIQTSLLTGLQAQDKRRLTNGGIKTAPFVVLLGVDAPSVLAEVTSLSNTEEAERLETSSYREQIASYLERGIVRYLSRSYDTALRQTREKTHDGEAKSKETAAQTKR